MFSVEEDNEFLELGQWAFEDHQDVVYVSISTSRGVMVHSSPPKPVPPRLPRNGLQSWEHILSLWLIPFFLPEHLVVESEDVALQNYVN